MLRFESHREKKVRMSESKRHLVVLFGGQSAEHEVSVTSARSMLGEINRERYDITLVGITREGKWIQVDESSNALVRGTVESDASATVLVDHGEGGLLRERPDGGFDKINVDIVFPLLHGPHGEDGTVQGLLELAGIATVGSGVAGSAVGMDKELTKRVFRAEGLPQVEHATIRRARWRERAEEVLVELEGRLGWPIFVKPARLGSSVGVNRANDKESLRAALDDAARFDTKIIVEAAAINCAEVECAVLGHEDPIASVVGEIVPTGDFYDYEAKYVSDDAELRIPAQISDQAAAEVQQLAVSAFRAVGASGLARVDFFVNHDDGSVLLNEINTIPGFTPISMYPKLWEESGIPYAELIDKLIDFAIARHVDKLDTSYSR